MIAVFFLKKYNFLFEENNPFKRVLLSDIFFFYLLRNENWMYRLLFVCLLIITESDIGNYKKYIYLYFMV